MSKTSYTFPFDTCESPSGTKVAQPVSVFVNLISVCIIVYFLIQSSHLPTRLFFTILLAFEAWHTFSHIRHIPGYIQVRIIHSLVYALNAAILYMLIVFTGIVPSKQFILLLASIVLLDLIAFWKLPMIVYFTTSLILTATIIIAFLPHVPRSLRLYLQQFLVILVILVLLFVNESFNCKRMMDYVKFPYHALIESVGVIAFILLGFTFSKWDSLLTSTHVQRNRQFIGILPIAN